MRKQRVIASAVLLAVAGALAAQSGPGKCPPYPDGSKADPTPLFRSIDKNNDGKLTREEWTAAEAPEPSWQAFVSKPRVKAHGYITFFDFVSDSPPPGIDTDCDGKITLEEFLATKKWKMDGGPGGPPPSSIEMRQGGPGAPPPPGGPGGIPVPPQTPAGRGEPMQPFVASDGPGKCPPYPDASKADPTPILEAIDTNHDGILTHEEWVAAGAPEPSWNMFMSKPKVKQQGYITYFDFLTESPPPGIDTNCDGYITMEEFQQTKKWKMGDGPPPGGPAPEGMQPPPSGPGGPPGGGPGGGNPGESRFNGLNNAVGLSIEQQGKVKAIMEKSEEDIRALQKQMPVWNEQSKAAIDKIWDTEKNSILALLEPDQKTKYEAYFKRWMDERAKDRH